MRRGQITLFVILGLVLLLLVVLFFAFRQRTFVEPVMEQLPPAFTPVQEHVQECLRLTTIDALKIIASHGGYLDPLDAEETGRPLRLDPYAPTESDLVTLNTADNQSSIPYYSYLVGPNECSTCVLTSLAPSKEHMEAMARKYVLANLHTCVNYGLFPDIAVTPAPEEELEIILAEQDVLIHYERELALARGAETVNVETFYQRLPIPFLNYYRTAVAIASKELRTQFLENYLLYLVSAYNGLGRDLPPISAFDEGFSPEFWILYDVQQRFAQILHSTTPSLQVVGTKGVVPPPSVNDPYVAGFLRMTYLDLLGNASYGQESFRITIFSPEQPLYVDVQPRDGQLLRPKSQRDSGILLIPPRQLNYYNFFYDLSAPFVVEIRHEEPIPGTDIGFLFALEANVRENKNMVELLFGRGALPWDPSAVTIDIDDPEIAYAAANDSYTVPDALYEHNKSVESLLCSPALRTVPFTTKIFDARTDEALPDVTLTYQCGYYATCDVGLSSMDDFGVYAVVDTKLPVCVGGTLLVEKAGYNSVSLAVTTRNGEPIRQPDIVLEPFVERQVRFEKRQLSRDPITEALSITPAKELEATETVFATLTRKSTLQGDAPVSATAFMSNETPAGTVSLIPGRYEIRAMFIDNEGHVIPAGCQVIQGTPIPENRTEIKPAPWGGLEYSEEKTFLWQLERDALYQNDELVIPVIVAPSPRCIDDLEDMGRSAEYTRRFRNDVAPRME